jgi:hypothetical protein
MSPSRFHALLVRDSSSSCPNAPSSIKRVRSASEDRRWIEPSWRRIVHGFFAADGAAGASG